MRRPGSSRIAATGVRAALLVLASAVGCSDPGSRPNVLVVVLDTVRADRCSFLGYDRPTTPRLGEFARDAVVFEDAWSPASWTAPAHATLFTGVDAHRLDLFRGLDTKLVGSSTLAERLAAAGWDTGMFSSNPWVGPETGLARGFSTVRQTKTDDHGDFLDSERLTDQALAWIRAEGARGSGSPWFAFVNYMDAHAPCDPPAAVSARFLRPGLPEAAVENARRLIGPKGLWASSFDAEPLPPDEDAAVSDLYDASLTEADAALGRLLDTLRADGSLDRTLVVVASDHGEGLGDHGWREHGLRLHRELLRVPLVVRFPGRFDGGRRVVDPVTLADVTPTVLAGCGMEPGPALDGRDLAVPGPARPALATDRPFAGWPMLAEETLPPAWRDQLECVRRSVYDGRLHLIVDDRGGAELYDVGTDPAETRNLAGERTDDVARLRALLDGAFGKR